MKSPPTYFGETLWVLPPLLLARNEKEDEMAMKALLLLALPTAAALWKEKGTVRSNYAELGISAGTDAR